MTKDMSLNPIPAAGEPRRSKLWSTSLILAGLAVAAFAVQAADARGGRGGFAPRGGAGVSMPRGGANMFGGARFTNPNRAGANAAQRPTGRPSEAGRPASNRTANANVANNGNASARFANGNSNFAAANNGNRNTGIVNSGNAYAGAVNNGNVNTGNINTGNVNVGNNVDVNVNQNGGWYGYPASTGAAYATGVAVGATATAAAIGSYAYALPSSCSSYVWSAYQYYHCSGTWYQQRYQGGSAVYVVVADPTKSK